MSASINELVWPRDRLFYPKHGSESHGMGVADVAGTLFSIASGSLCGAYLGGEELSRMRQWLEWRVGPGWQPSSLKGAEGAEDALRSYCNSCLVFYDTRASGGVR